MIAVLARRPQPDGEAVEGGIETITEIGFTCSHGIRLIGQCTFCPNSISGPASSLMRVRSFGVPRGRYVTAWYDASGVAGKAKLPTDETAGASSPPRHGARALTQIATLPGTPALRREQIKLQVALITPLIHIKGYAAPETKAAIEQARLMLEQAEALGEPPEDPLLLFSVLYGVFVANVMAFKGDVSGIIAGHTLELAEKQSASFPRVLGHNNRGGFLMLAGERPNAVR